MNFYPFHIGDWMSHTRHLNLEEEAVYRRMLDQYYLHERPLNGSSTDIARLINARGTEDTVEAILNEFFVHDDEVGWINHRANKEIERYQNKRLQASKAGKISAQRRLNARSTDVQPTKTNTKTITSVKKKTPSGSKKKFTKPTVDQVCDYCKTRNNKVDPQTFIDFYEAKGWMIGTGKMKDWQACVRTWEKRDNSPQLGNARKSSAGLNLLKEIAR